MEVKEILFPWNENFSIFASESYLKSISSYYGWIGGFLDDDLKFVLPYAIKKRIFFRSLVFTTDTILLNNVNDPNLEKWFLNATVKHFCKEKIDFIQQPSTHVVFSIFPDSSIYTQFGTYQVDLTANIELLWDKVHSKHRNAIRNAEKNHIKVEHGKNYRDLAFNILQDTMLRSNMSFVERKLFDNLIWSLGDHIEIFVAFKDDEPQGCAVIPFSEHSGYYLWGGSIINPFQGSMNMLHWEIMKYLKSFRVKKYDLVGARISPEPGSRLEGIQRFKSRFGAKMRTGYLWKYQCNPVTYKLYRYLSLIKNWKQRSSLGDIIDQELGIGKL